MKLQMGEVVCLLNQLELDVQDVLDASLPNKQQHAAASRMLGEKFNTARDKVTAFEPDGILVRDEKEQQA